MQAGDIPPVTVTAEEQSSNTADIASRTLHAHTACRILVVDDNIINCEVAVQMLQKLGCCAEAALAGHDASDMHARQHFDMILMDCQMPRLDGYQTTALIRAADAGGKHTVIIGWTSSLDAEERTKCIRAGMDDVMTKPLECDAVHEMIKRWGFAPTSTRLFQLRNSFENDLDSVQHRFGVNFPELAALYQIDTVQRIAAMRKAYAEDNLSQMAAIGHILGSSCASIGALRLASMCREFEVRCKAAISCDFELLLNEIEDEYRKTDLNIRTLLQSSTL